MTKEYTGEKYKYYDPKEECLHPLRSVKNIELIYEETEIHNADRSLSIAYITHPDGHISVGIRWNIAYDQYKDEKCARGEQVCLGFPYSRGYPTWFILPQGTEWNMQNNTLIIPLGKENKESTSDKEN